MKPINQCLLYGMIDTGYVAAENLQSTTALLLEGGVDIIQLRAKKESPREIISIARQMAPACHAAGIPFILNDHPELVQETGASGVHVGQEDLSVEEARALAGTGAIVGKSTHSLEQALAAIPEAPDYIGFGPLFATPTKPDYSPVGTKMIREVHRLVPIPVFCIGGIKLSNLPQVMAAGARRVVIVSDLLQSDDPAAQSLACKALLVR